MSDTVPSFRNGFAAPGRGRLRYADLWHRCQLAWCPFLGAQGPTLFDWSRYKRHGTLTSMDPSTDYVPSGGFRRSSGYALDFDGSDDHVLLTSAPVTGYPISQSVWVYLTTDQGRFVGGVCNSSNSRYFVIDYNNVNDQFAYRVRNAATTASALTPASSVVLNQWYHVVAVSRSATDHEIFLNGVSAGTSTTSVTPTAVDRVILGATMSSGSLVNFWPGLIDDYMLWDRALSPGEILLLSSRRAIAYERAPRRMGVSATVASKLLLRLQTEGLFVGSAI